MLTLVRPRQAIIDDRWCIAGNLEENSAFTIKFVDALSLRHFSHVEVERPLMEDWVAVEC